MALLLPWSIFAFRAKGKDRLPNVRDYDPSNVRGTPRESCAILSSSKEILVFERINNRIPASNTGLQSKRADELDL